ncbi:MAG: hypothetical protein ACRC2V_00690 [Xenococcaceae cyanobacterium]
MYRSLSIEQQQEHYVGISSRSQLNFEQDWLIDSTRILQKLNCCEPVDRDEAFTQNIVWKRSNPPEIYSLMSSKVLDYET